MKKIVSLLLAVLMIFSLTACQNDTANNSDKQTAEKKIECDIFVLQGPTGIGAVSLWDKAEKGETSIDYKFNMVAANEDIVAKVVNGDADIAAVATNVASNLYNKTNGNVSVIAINTLGVLNVVTKDENIKTIADLKGKTIYLPGQGANPEFITNYILEKNNLKVGTDVKLEFVGDGSELVPKIIGDKENKVVVIAPQPVATTITVQDKNAKIAINLNDEWDKCTDTNLVMGSVIVNNKFLKENPDAVKTFLKDYENSVKAVNADPKTAGTLCEKYGVVPKAAIATKAIPYCNIVCQTGAELKANLSAYLKFLFDIKPALVGEKLPSDEFYYDN